MGNINYYEIICSGLFKHLIFIHFSEHPDYGYYQSSHLGMIPLKNPNPDRRSNAAWNATSSSRLAEVAMTTAQRARRWMRVEMHSV